MAYRKEQTELDEASALMRTTEIEVRRIERENNELRAMPDRPLIDAWYAAMLVFVLTDGLIGESAALLGAVGFHAAGYSVRILAFGAASCILVMIGLMAQSALLRFRPQGLTSVGPLFIAVLLGLAGIGIGIAIFSSGATAKPKPSPTPSHVKITPERSTSPLRRDRLSRPTPEAF